MSRIRILNAVATIVVFYTTLSFSADNIIFPGRADVYDITKVAGWQASFGNGQTDVTQRLRDILIAAHQARNTVGWVNAIVYLPKGKYLVSDTISWPFNTPSMPYAIGPHLIGQSRDSTIIILKDNTARFADSTKPRWLISTGDGVAQFFNRGIQNLTINTGKGNFGVIALNYFGNNQSIASDLNIISPDGSGHAGMDLSLGEEGPALATKIYIHGYKYGIWANALNSVTLSRIRIVGSRWYGIYNQRNPLYIDSLFTDSCGRKLVGSIMSTSGCAVANEAGGSIVLSDAYMFNGLPPAAAVRCEGSSIFVRNLNSTGYARGLMCTNYPVGKAPAVTNYFSEYTNGTDTALFTPAAHVSMNLPVQYPPEVAWETDTTKWAFPTDANALQNAIDNGQYTHICIPKGSFALTKNIYLRGKIRRFIMSCSQLTGGIGGYKLYVSDGLNAAPVVKLEKLASGTNNLLPIVIRTKRQVILEALTIGPNITCDSTAAGELYVQDITSPIICTNPNQKIWAWHYNAEGGGSSYMLDMSAGTARIFGWKDEGNGVSVRMTGGTAELLGFYNYSSDENKGTTPQFTLSGTTQFCAVMATQHNWSNPDTTANGWYHVLVQEARNNVTRTLTRENNHNNYSLPLYCAFTPSAVQSALVPSSNTMSKPKVRITAQLVRVSYVLKSEGLVSIVVTALNGSVIYASQTQRGAGNYVQTCALENVPARGIYVVSIAQSGRSIFQSKFLLK